MIQRLVSIFIFFYLIWNQAFAQNTAIIQGKISEESGEPLPFATISLVNSKSVIFSDQAGTFKLTVPADIPLTLQIEFKGKISQFLSIQLKTGEVYNWNVTMPTETLVLDSVVIDQKSKENLDRRSEVSTYTINPKIPKFLPSAFNDFNKILVTLPGVYSNSELSSQYNVRGGNYDENLVYVNDIEIYRPYLVRSGQQEGLSFVNPDMVKQVEFSAGGWQPRFGDKLSSVLSVKYKVPYRFKASGSASLLGGTLHAEGASKNERISFIVGAREKSAAYLLNTLPTKGEYKPRFFDVQSYVNIDLTKDKKPGDESKTTLGILASFAKNNYFIIPSHSQTKFGTLYQALSLDVNFRGRETLEYETFQSGMKLSHTHSEKVKTDWIVSMVRSAEREYGDVEGAYKLSELNTDPNSSQFNQPLFTLGTGSQFTHTRSKLNVGIYSFSHKGYYNRSDKSKLQWGFSQNHETIQDHLFEYAFLDSAGYVTINRYLNTSANLSSYRSQLYAQHSVKPDSSHSFTYGFRVHYWTLNKQLLFSPRIQYAWKPKWKKDILFKMSAGVYQQSPFYRELRDMTGQVHTDVKAQTSIHVIGGSDINFKAWGRDFKFIAEVYGKYLYHVIPYDVDNVRIRYYAVNNAKAYVAGTDFRLGGEFIKDAESWFSLGVLTTREDVAGDGRGYIRRPTDQRVTAAIFFQDQLPTNPSIKAYLNLVYGTGLPFGVPNSYSQRSIFSAPPYRRVDIGFSKLISYSDKQVKKGNPLESLWISLEILNLLGVNNTISYLWITDYSNNRYAVPNTLSTRFINLRVVANF